MIKLIVIGLTKSDETKITLQQGHDIKKQEKNVQFY
jgi:hypothetical protein